MDRRAWRWLARWWPALLLAFFHWAGIMSKIIDVDAETFRRDVVEIEVTDSWRYGYIRGHHGATLFKTRNLPEVTWSMRSPEDPELRAAMLVELRLYPWKCVLEAMLYGAAVIYALVFVPYIRAKVERYSFTWPLAALRECIFWTVGWTLLAAPLLFMGYGASLFTTWAGPGAYSWSGPYIGMARGYEGETISYRIFIETITMFPASVAIGAMPAWLANRVTTSQFVWLAGIPWWGGMGFAIGISMGVFRVRSRIETGEQSAP